MTTEGVSCDRVFVIAEAGVNHDGDPDRALALVDAAAAAGADAVKFQTFSTDKLVVAGAPKAAYQRAATGDSQDQAEMLRRLELDESTHRRLATRCAERSIEFMSTPFDDASVDMLANVIAVRRLKVGSGEITNGRLLLAMARTGLPIVLSTGMSRLQEIEAALGVLAFGMIAGDGSKASRQAFAAAYTSPEGRRALAERVTLLHCTSEYPAPVEEANLRAMETLRGRFALPVGLSDHTPGVAVATAAVALGAVVIEKHLTLDPQAAGPDHAASLAPDAFSELVAGIRVVEQALGSAEKAPTGSERANMAVARRSLVALVPIRKGEPFTEVNLGARRPGNGLSPMRYWELLGRPASRDYAPGQPIEP